MPRPSRPKDGNQTAKFVVTWLPGLLQTIKKVLEVIRQEHKPTRAGQQRQSAGCQQHAGETLRSGAQGRRRSMET